MKGMNADPVRILAVDDERGVLDLYRDALSFPISGSKSEYHFKVVLCERGDEALDKVRKANDGDEPFSVVFLDLNLMQGPDGIWTGEQIRNLDPYVNVVIVTGMPGCRPARDSPAHSA